MQITLTWSDIALSLLLGVLGSLIAAYLFGRVPQWSSQFSTFLAERSKKAAHARLAKLRRDLRHVKALKNDVGRHIGWLTLSLARFVMSFSFGLSALIIAAVFTLPDYSQRILKLLDPEYVVPYLTEVAAVGYYVLIGMGVTMFSLAVISAFQVRNYSNLDARIATIEKQITALEQRVGQTEQSPHSSS